jgi:DNA-binding GntR family transcriptional regulator
MIKSSATCKVELDKGRVEYFVDFDTKLHSLVLTYCGNRYLQKTMNSLNNLIYYFRAEIAKNIDRSVEAFHEHNRILRALKKQDGDLAEEAMKDHIFRTIERTLEDIDLSNG